MNLAFAVYTTPAPQGSMKAFVIKGRARVTSDNKKTMPYRHAVTQIARRELADRNLNEPMAAKHVPVSLLLDFYLAKPASIPKKRVAPAVKPDIDKLCRATLDALTGVLFADDGQVTEIRARKHYATGPEHVLISATVLP